MVKKKRLGKIVFNWKGYKLRHVNHKGGKLAVYRGKKKIDGPEYGTYIDGVNALKKSI